MDREFTPQIETALSALEKERERVDELAAERQTTLHGQRVINRGRFDIEFDEYLYESLAVTHPRLADIAALGEKLTKVRQRFDRALSSR